MWLGVFWSSLSTHAFSLPFDQVSDPYCQKWIHRSELDESCKIDFELPDPSVFESASNSREKLQFSVLYKDDYADWYRTDAGHPGLDFVSAEWTPLLSITDGIVINSEFKNWYGNTIIVKSTSTWEELYFNYAHLEKRHVQEGDTVTEWEQIWTIGRTWFVMWKRWYHLELQITKANSPIHPYSHSECTQATYMEAVETGICNNDLDKYTINPLTRLHKAMGKEAENLYISPLAKKEDVYTEVEIKTDYNQILLEEIMIPLLAKSKEKETNDIIEQEETAVIENVGMLEVEYTYTGPEVVQTTYTTAPSPSNISTSTNAGTFTLPGLVGSRNIQESSKIGYTDLVITITDQLGNPYTGKLPEKVDITLDDTVYSSYISSISSIRNGSKTVLLKIK